MKEMIERVLNNYLSVKEQDLKDNKEANFIRNDVKTIIEQQTNLDKQKYLVTGSSGQGNWAEIPWIAIFDKDITVSATSGYDIVYLFCADMSGVYLSLNQGWTYFKNKYKDKQGKENIKIVSSHWKKNLKSTLTDFSFNEINLRGSGSLAKGYELGHICGKFYEKENIPPRNVLIDDLRNILGVYRELKGKMAQLSIEKTNDQILANQIYGFNDDSDNSNNLDVILNENAKTYLIKENCPSSLRSYQKTNFNAKQIDFISKVESSKKIGLAGEIMVLNYERDKLKKLGKFDLLDKIKHISVEEGDGAGYDILSFDGDGNEMFIEVKTTVRNSTEPFYITSNEMEFSKTHYQNYYIYRIYDFSTKDNSGKLYMLKGDLSKILELKAQQFVVQGFR